MAKINSNYRKSESKSIESICHDIQSSKIKSFYLLHGEDHRLIKKYSLDLLQLLIPMDLRDGNFLQMPPKNCPVHEIIDFCDTLPFLAPRRVLLLENFPLLQQSKKNSKKLEFEQKQLINWLDQKKYPDSTFCIIFTFYEDTEKNTITTSNPLYKMVVRNGEILQCPLPEEVFEFLTACNQKNASKAMVQLQKLFDEGIGTDAIAYGLMPRLRYPLKRLLSESISNPGDSMKLRHPIHIYNQSLVTEEKLRPRYQDIISENSQYVLEQWILESFHKSDGE